MNREDILDKKIENYIHNRMSDTERIGFEESLKADLKLRNDVLELLALKTLYNSELFELKKKLNATENELDKENFFDEGGEG
jgi:hypothetical protein